ncbi:MAG: OadG family protein [Lachnospiraceae bacterium]|nr:OadG family protein [Lachnospiraceae bacterium]
MKNMKKRLTGLFVTLVMLMTMLMAVPVSASLADFSEEEKLAIRQSAESYLSSVFVMDDTQLEGLKEYGNFYEIMGNALLDSREELGDFVELEVVNQKDVDNKGAEPQYSTIDETEENIYVTLMAKFTNYDAEVIMSFDETASTPVNFVMNTQYSLGEKMAQAGVNTITGILIVFIILLFLAFLISLFKYVNPAARKKKAAPAPAAAPAPKKAAPAPVVETVDVASNDEEIIAVIAAAIAAAEADGTATGDSYVVRSIKRVGNTRSWKRA